MRRLRYKKYIPLAVFLFLLLLIPPFFVERGRSIFFSFFKPLWKGSSYLQKPTPYEKAFRRLEAENQILGREWARLKAIIEQNSAVNAYQKILQPSAEDTVATRKEKNALLLQLKKGVVGQVIYRDPTSWSSSVWIDVGEETNQELQKKIIQKNSPVLLGKAVVGAVEYVGQKHSRVRLITDPGLKVAVRALRGSTQNLLLLEKMEFIQRALSVRSNLPLDAAEVTLLTTTLNQVREKIEKVTGEDYLAKGVISGGGTPLFRSKHSLKGTGFNYDFPDSKGAARDLVARSLDATPLLQVHDILVTTGMDALFPPGLPVAEVTKIFPLKEGAFCYDIEAMPIYSLDDISFLYVIPPSGFPLDLFPSKA